MQHIIGQVGRGILLIVVIMALMTPLDVSGADTTGSDAGQKLWNVAVRVGGNFAWFTSGDYYRGVSSAFGYDADVMVALSRKVALRVTVGKAGIKPETDPAVISSETVTQYIYRNYDVSATRVFISGQYCWDFLFERLAKKGLGRTAMGVSLGLGVVTHEQSVDGVMYPVAPAVSDTQTKFAITTGYSYTQMLGERVGLYVLVESDIVFLGSPPDAEVHWKENGGIAFLEHLRFGLTCVF